MSSYRISNHFRTSLYVVLAVACCALAQSFNQRPPAQQSGFLNDGANRGKVSNGYNTARRSFSVGNRCTNAQIEQMRQCESYTRDDWDVLDVNIVSYQVFVVFFAVTISNSSQNERGRKFCCYIWNTLDCEVKVIRECDPNYASQLAFAVEQSYGSMCEWPYNRRSAMCALRWWSLLLIFIGVILLIMAIVFVLYRRKRANRNDEYSTVPKGHY